jgi:hypothetical protein
MLKLDPLDRKSCCERVEFFWNAKRWYGQARVSAPVLKYSNEGRHMGLPVQGILARLTYSCLAHRRDENNSIGAPAIFPRSSLPAASQFVARIDINDVVSHVPAL